MRWLLVALCPIAAAVGVSIGTAGASSALIDLGPNDARYARGFRDVERDGPAYVRWSVAPESHVVWPLRVCGSGAVALRVRRHFVEPARIGVELDGRLLGRATVAAGGDLPYQVLVFPFTTGACDVESRVSVRLESPDPRGLGTTVDWVRIESHRGLRPSVSSVSRWPLSALAIASALAMAGARAATLWAALALFAFGPAVAALLDPISTERFGRAVLPAATPSIIVALAIRSLRRAESWVGSALGVALLGGGLQLPFLAQTAFYPDYWVHGLVTRHLASAGIGPFVENLFSIQYERSLGLQQVDGRWYPFPYPPGSYLLPAAYNLFADLSSVEAVIALGVAATALVSLATILLGRLFGLSESAALAAGVVIAVAPLLSRRQALGYFPGLTGLAVDTLVACATLRLLRGGAGAGAWAATGLALTGAFLVYTQSVLTFGLVGLGLLVAVAAGVGDRRRILALAALLLAAAVLAFGSFYANYAPVLRAIGEGRSLPEESVLARLDAVRSARLLPEQITEEPNDPFAGPGLSVVRAARKAIHRLGLFFGPLGCFFWLGVGGLWQAGRTLVPAQRLLVVVLSLTFPLIVFLSAGLPGPNGFRHLKDLEAVTPLIAVGLAAVCVDGRGSMPRAIGVLALGAWVILGLTARCRELADRLLPV